MSQIQIVNYFTEEVIFTSPAATIGAAVKDALEQGVDLSYVDLRGADLSGARGVML